MTAEIKIIQIFSGMTKILVGLGIKNVDAVEVVNLDESGQICNNLPDYPFENAAATGQLIRGSIPMICGGVTETKAYYDHCECFALINGIWEEVCPLKSSKFQR